MKKIASLIAGLLAASLCLTSCFSVGQLGKSVIKLGSEPDGEAVSIPDSEQSEEQPEDEFISAKPLTFLQDNHITVDTESRLATFNDGTISFSWPMDKWSFCLYKNRPSLSASHNDRRFTFSILDASEGMASSFGKYAVKELAAYHGISESIMDGELLAADVDPYFADRGYFGIRTGYYELIDRYGEYTLIHNFGITHVITDGKKSAILYVSTRGNEEDIDELMNSLFNEEEDYAYSPMLETIFSEAFDTFRFVGDGSDADAPDATAESEKETIYITYEKARARFSEVYSTASTHAEYVDYVNSETEKMMTLVSDTYGEILNALDSLYETVISSTSPGMTYEEYKDRYITPFMEYYEKRAETLRQSENAYNAVSCAECYPGNAASDSTAVWKYVNYRNFYAELLDVKAYLQ